MNVIDIGILDAVDIDIVDMSKIVQRTILHIYYARQSSQFWRGSEVMSSCLLHSGITVFASPPPPPKKKKKSSQQ